MNKEERARRIEAGRKYRKEMWKPAMRLNLYRLRARILGVLTLGLGRDIIY